MSVVCLRVRSPRSNISVEGSINEYLGKGRVFRNGEVAEVDTMTEVEELEVPLPFGKLEAFHTSGGSSTLPQTYKGPCRVMTQLASKVLMIRSTVLLAEFNRGKALQKLFLKYAYAQQSEMIQSAVCHSLHTIRQRFCRCLLVISDCVQSDSFDVTQEHVANMLGHHRNRITLAARELLQQGLIDYGGGNMKILNRAGLGAAARQCYRVVKDSVEQVFAA